MTDRLEEILKDPFHRWLVEPEDKRKAWQVAADALRAAGATVPEPPQGPVYVTSEATAKKWVARRHHEAADLRLTIEQEARRDLDYILPDLAKDHGLLTPQEVERRAREFGKVYPLLVGTTDKLVAALTRPAPGRGV